MAKEGTTRYYSDLQETKVAEDLNGLKTSNSGAYHFRKGDVIVSPASLLVECKTCTKDKNSFSIQKEWIEKNKEECFSQRLSNNCIAINFGPNQDNYYLINTRLMKELIDKLKEDIDS